MVTGWYVLDSMVSTRNYAMVTTDTDAVPKQRERL